MIPAIIVHGGAGNWQASPRLEEALAACRQAAETGRAILASSGSALDAVEAAIRALEDAPALDAGRGSYANAAGEVELDAIIMDGRTLDLGAVAAVQRLPNPITLARRVMTGTPHTFLAGAGAEAFAEAIGLPRCSTDDLLVGDELQAARQLRRQPLPVDGSPRPQPECWGNTVGAVAIDSQGNLAAGTSTGGTKRKMPGRVGDSPLVGSGAYADNWMAAASATGHGEELMKVVISKRVCDFVAQGLATQSACEAAIRVLAERVNGRGGVIAIDARGRVGSAHNTAGMPYAYAIGRDEIISSH